MIKRPKNKTHPEIFREDLLAFTGRPLPDGEKYYRHPITQDIVNPEDFQPRPVKAKRTISELPGHIKELNKND